MVIAPVVSVIVLQPKPLMSTVSPLAAWATAKRNVPDIPLPELPSLQSLTIHVEAA